MKSYFFFIFISAVVLCNVISESSNRAQKNDISLSSSNFKTEVAKESKTVELTNVGRTAKNPNLQNSNVVKTQLKESDKVLAQQRPPLPSKGNNIWTITKKKVLNHVSSDSEESDSDSEDSEENKKNKKAHISRIKRSLKHKTNKNVLKHVNSDSEESDSDSEDSRENKKKKANKTKHIFSQNKRRLKK